MPESNGPIASLNKLLALRERRESELKLTDKGLRRNQLVRHLAWMDQQVAGMQEVLCSFNFVENSNGKD